MRGLLGLGALVVVVAAVAGWRLYRIADHLATARTALDRAGVAVEGGELGVAGQELARGERAILAANNSLHNAADLTAISWVPVVSQNVDALRSSVGVAFTLVTGGRQILETADPLAGDDGRLKVPLRDGAVPVGALAETLRQVNALASSLPGEADASRPRLLVGRISTLYDAVHREAAERKDQLTSLGAGLQLLTEMSGADGPKRYLIAVANAAEMRGTGGMILSYGILNSGGGDFTLERFGPIDELDLPGPVPLTQRPDYVSRYPGLAADATWRNANVGANFTEVGPVLEAMFQAATGTSADGVIQIDSVGLAAILEGVGPVEVPELGTVTSENVVALTLNEAYVRFPDRVVRQDYLEMVAEAAFDRLVTGDYPDLRPLAHALVRAAAGRHVMFHSASAPAQRAVIRLGADGGLPEPDNDFAHLTVQNFSGNKLDYYLDSRLVVTGRRQVGRPSTLRAEISVTNAAPPLSAPRYIFGPFLDDFRVGEYRGLVTLYLPSSTAFVGQEGGPWRTPPSVGSEGDRTAISYGISLLPGETSTVALEVLLPSRGRGPYRWTFVPSPRVRPVVARVDLDLGPGRLSGEQPLDRPVVFEAGD